MVHDFVTSIYTRPEMGEHILVGGPDLPTFRLARFAEGKPIRGTYGDWLMC